MALPILKILWAPTNSAHYNHLHVEGDPKYTGNPPYSNPGMTPAVSAIYQALNTRFGDWTNLGIYNRRYIAGTTIWSQHAYANAIDIGPYYGVEEQQKFYDFLTEKEEDMTPPSWAIAATQWHIDRGIYTEATPGDVDEELEFHRQTVYRHRFYNAIKGEFGAAPHSHTASTIII